MKNLKYIFGSIAASILITSCSLDAVSEESESIYATGDQADDPIEPDEEDALFIDKTFSTTGDQADDPIEPDDED